MANRVQLVLAEKLGFSPNNNLSAMEAISKFQEVFNSQLHHQQLAALADLFKMSLPESGLPETNDLVITPMISSSVQAC